MFKLFRTEQGTFKILNSEIDTEGSLRDAVDVMESLGTPTEHINLALNEMQKNEHNIAEFGTNINTGLPGFIFTARGKLTYVSRNVTVPVVDFDTVQALKAA